MSFEVQQILMVMAAAAATLRRRVNILIFAANHFILLRAFQNIELHGQPASYRYLPTFLFEPERIAEASEILLVPTAMLVAAALVPWPVPVRTEPLPTMPRAVQAVVAAYLVFIFFSTRTLFQVAYASTEQTLYGSAAGGGIYVLAWALVTFELRRRVDAQELSPTRALSLATVLLFLLDFIKGSTGLASGILIGVAFQVFLPGLLGEGRSTGPARRELRANLRTLGFALALLVALGGAVALIRNARAFIASDGVVVATSRAVERLTSLTDDDSDVGIEAAGNGSQGAAHVLMCISLYDNGLSREWRSITGPIEYTFKPSVLIRVLDLERSREAAWELGDYFIHVGGINVFGEFYWNGGYVCLIVMSGLLIGFLLVVDVKSRSSWAWLALACSIAPGLLQGYGYGYAQVFRGIANGALFFLPLLVYLRWVESRRARPLLSVVRPHAPVKRAMAAEKAVG